MVLTVDGNILINNTFWKRPLDQLNAGKSYKILKFRQCDAWLFTAINHG